MPSPAEPVSSVRIRLERAARWAGLGVLVWLVLLSFRDRAASPHVETTGAGLPAALARWTARNAPATVHVRLISTPTAFERDWLRGLAGAGARISWEGPSLPPLALVVEPAVDPSGGTLAWAAAAEGARVVLEDATGPLDSALATAGGVRFLVRSAPKRLSVRLPGGAAASGVTDSLDFGRVLLLGRVGWESKFVLAALEERGWHIEARLRLSPRHDVVQGKPVAIDTARYDAVIVLDSGSVNGSVLAEYVCQGGGVVLAAPATKTPGLAPLGARRSGAVTPPREPFDSAAREPRRELGLDALEPGPDGVVLERRGPEVAVAARRVGRGRVVWLGYGDTWRWRLGGGHDAMAQHQDWWADLLGGVARVRRHPLANRTSEDEAPLAMLVDRLGPATSAPPPTGQGRFSRAWLFALLTALMCLEWASRRLRGAR